MCVCLNIHIDLDEGFFDVTKVRTNTISLDNVMKYEMTVLKTKKSSSVECRIE